MKLLNYMIFDGGFWIRVFGRGVSVSDKIKNPPLFSERYGHVRVLRFGKWGIKWLKKTKQGKNLNLTREESP